MEYTVCGECLLIITPAWPDLQHHTASTSRLITVVLRRKYIQLGTELTHEDVLKRKLPKI